MKGSAAQLFYDRLFEIDPLLRGLFRSDMRQQGAKLMQVMGAVVNGLSRLELIVRLIEELGRRHVDYGVEDHHYDMSSCARCFGRSASA
jgi:hemoglobin-like flavoprotein